MGIIEVLEGKAFCSYICVCSVLYFKAGEIEKLVVMGLWFLWNKGGVGVTVLREEEMCLCYGREAGKDMAIIWWFWWGSKDYSDLKGAGAAMFATRHCSVNKFLFLSYICVNLEPTVHIATPPLLFMNFSYLLGHLQLLITTEGRGDVAHLVCFAASSFLSPFPSGCKKRHTDKLQCKISPFL